MITKDVLLYALIGVLTVGIVVFIAYKIGGSEFALMVDLTIIFLLGYYLFNKFRNR